MDDIMQAAFYKDFAWEKMCIIAFKFHGSQMCNCQYISLVRVMPRCRTGNKPIPEPMMSLFTNAIWSNIRPYWVYILKHVYVLLPRKIMQHIKRTAWWFMYMRYIGYFKSAPHWPSCFMANLHDMIMSVISWSELNPLYAIWFWRDIKHIYTNNNFYQFWTSSTNDWNSSRSSTL